MRPVHSCTGLPNAVFSLRAGLLALGLAVSACSPMPELAGAAPSRADLPPVMLIPLDGLLAEADALDSESTALGGLEARLAALRARAALLRAM